MAGLPVSAGAQSAAAPIRIAGSATDPFMVPYYAEDLGYFVRDGVNVDLTTLPTAAAVVQAVAAGAADVGQGDTIQLANAVSHGIPLAIFAGGALYRSEQAQISLVVAANSRIRNARDLAGRTVGVVTLNSLSAVGMQAWLRKNNVDPAGVKLSEVSFPQMLPSIAKGLIDAAVIGNPYLSSPEIRILTNMYDSIGREFYIASWFARRDWLAQNRDTVRRFIATIYSTARWANAHRVESAAILSKYEKIDLPQVQKMVRTSYATSPQPKLVGDVLAAAYEFKALPVQMVPQDLIAAI